MLAYEISLYARENFQLVDSDAIASIQSLAESYRTLSSGLYYEKPPEYRVQRELYEKLQAAVEGYKKQAQGVDLTSVPRLGVTSVRDGVIRDILIFMAQLGAIRTNGRPRSRAYLDFLRTQFKPEAFARPESKIVLP